MKIIAKKFFEILGKSKKYNLKVSFADGSLYENAPEGIPDIEVIFKNTRGQFALATEGYIGLAEAYIEGHVDINGIAPITKLAELGAESGAMQKSALVFPTVWLKQRWWEYARNNKSFAQAKQNAIEHYNLPADFFHILLGPTYGYTEGYYQENYSGNDDTAQHDKFDYIAKKLRLEPGLKVVEVGSGWGYLSILMAEKYDVDVVNYGIVPQQNLRMQEMIQAKGLEKKIHIVDRDHRELENEPNTYDRYVSVGVYEHAGKDCHEEWIRSIASCLKPGGIGVISTMGFMHEQLTSYLTTRYVFPGGNLPSIPKTLVLMEKYGLTVIDMENLWHHYERATAYWAKNLDTHWEEMRKINPVIFNDHFYRIWRLYLEGCGVSFTDAWGGLNVFHITFTKGRKPEYYPARRDFLYKK